MHTIEEEDAPASERQGIQVIARAAALLRALERRPEGLSLGELAKAVSLPRSTVRRPRASTSPKLHAKHWRPSPRSAEKRWTCR